MFFQSGCETDGTKGLAKGEGQKKRVREGGTRILRRGDGRGFTKKREQVWPRREEERGAHHQVCFIGKGKLTHGKGGVNTPSRPVKHVPLNETPSLGGRPASNVFIPLVNGRVTKLGEGEGATENQFSRWAEKPIS